MNTYQKILFTTLPLVFLFLFTMVGTTYYFARTAITELAETWLDTRLTEAMRATASQADILREYGLEEVPASIAKAKMDTSVALANIDVGEHGYIFAVDTRGIIVLHPDPSKVGTDIGRQDWYPQLQRVGGKLVYTTPQGCYLARYDYFARWQWFIIATSPEAEVYGVTKRIRPYIFSLGIVCSIVLVVALMILTQHLTNPLRYLTDGALRFGRGDLDTRIALPNGDEFGQLASVFNQMAGQIEQTLTALQNSHHHLEQRVHDRTVELEAKNQELREFANIVSHDLKAPLRAISYLTHWIATDYAPRLDKQGQDMMQLVVQRVQRLDSMIEGILSYTRIGAVSGIKKKVDLNRVFNEVTERLAPPENIRIQRINPLPVVFQDPVPMEQIFQNLIDNAMKFMGKSEGWIRVGCLDADSHWLFSVADNGPGIDPRYHTKIFQMFQTLNARDDFESTGIGLAQVKKNVDHLGGGIRVISEAGEGSTFIFSLPKS